MIKRKGFPIPQKTMKVEREVNDDFELFEDDPKLEEVQLSSKNTVPIKKDMDILGRRRKIVEEEFVESEIEESDDEIENVPVDISIGEKNTMGKKPIMIQVMHHPKLLEGTYQAVIGDIREILLNQIGAFGQKEEMLVIPFTVTTAEGEVVTVNWKTDKDVNPDGRLLSVVLAIYGDIPKKKFDLRDIEERKVEISVVHHHEENGGSWNKIVAVNGWELAC